MDEYGCAGCIMGSSFFGCLSFILLVLFFIFIIALLGG